MGRWILLTAGVFRIFAAFSQPAQKLEIFNIPEGEYTASYCRGELPVAPQVFIEGRDLDQPNDGIKVSFASNFKKGEDTLIYKGSAKITATWDNNSGTLTLRGKGTAAEYTQAVRDVYYENLAQVPTLLSRSLSVSLSDADYLPATQHFYKYVKKTGIYWTQARDSAERMSYNGLKGYLATITSREENDFIWTKLSGIGWIGASDAGNEGVWKWVTGPEAGQQFWQGNYTGHAVNGMFSYWNTGEPNNTQKSWGVGEDYGHINMNPTTIPRSWNDLPDISDGPNSQYYYSQGFIVEFGGLEDTKPRLSASVRLDVHKIAFSDKRDFTICQGEKVTLNLKASGYTYQWTPAQDISSTTVSNPVVTPQTTTTYRAVGTLGFFCADTADFTVKVNPLPVSLLADRTPLCQGGTVTLDPGDHLRYRWSNGDTVRNITVSQEGRYTVHLANQYCQLTDTTQVEYSLPPDVTFRKLDTLVCGSKNQRLEYSLSEGTSLLHALEPVVQVADATSGSPVITAPQFGDYRFGLQLTNRDGCRFDDTLQIAFRHQPTARFSLDSTTCKGYNLQVKYVGERENDALFYWFSNDTVYSSGINLEVDTIPLGVGIFNRQVGLKVDEQGCVATTFTPVSVTPLLEFWPETTEGCTPLEVQFSHRATESIAGWSWDFGDGNSSSLQNPVNIYRNPSVNDTVFDVTLRVVSEEGCENIGILEKAVMVHPIPSVGFDLDPAVCYDDTFRVNYRGSGTARDKYLWNLADIPAPEILQDPANSSGPLVFHRRSKPVVSLGISVESEFGCQSQEFRANLKRRPVFELSMDNTAGCPPLEVHAAVTPLDLTDQVSYSWMLGSDQPGTGPDFRPLLRLPDQHYALRVVAASSTTGCADTILVPDAVQVYPVPRAAFIAKPPVALISNPLVAFENKSENAQHYTWDFNDQTGLHTDVSPSHRFKEMGLFRVLLTAVNDWGCSDTTSREVVVAFDRLFPPTAFSPNSSKAEDREFRLNSTGIKAEGFQLLVFNRWGEMIFESNSPETGWDGRVKNGNFAPPGVYTWVVNYLDFRDKTHRQQGTVTLLF